MAKKRTTVAKPPPSSAPVPADPKPPGGRSKVRRDPMFGERVRQVRLGRTLTLQQLSKRCGLAASTLSKVEQNKISPSYENVLRLAEGLDLDVSELLGGEAMRMAAGRRSVTRAGNGARVTTAQYDCELLGADLARKQFAPVVAKLKARSLAAFPDFIRHDGEEFVYVLSGEMELLTEHYEPLRLAVGDSCYFDSRMGHACLSVGDHDAVVLWVSSRLAPGDGNPT